MLLAGPLVTAAMIVPAQARAHAAAHTTGKAAAAAADHGRPGLPAVNWALSGTATATNAASG
ncbi:MAG: hypothetical protein JO242_18930, partial [Streptosporangiaceae bacterium]|nr:hypothetical protein [Streptosporangiaceae bacterium]